jgi:hypothetical protein
MAGVVDLAAWRRKHETGEVHDTRLGDAVDRLDQLLTEERWQEPPAWLVTELMAVQGCVSMGLFADAHWRIERLIRRAERTSVRSRRAR